MSAIEAFHYLGIPYPALCAAISIALLGMINFFGPTKAGAGAITAALFLARNHQLITLAICLASEPAKWVLEIDPNADSTQRKRLQEWIKSSI